jgi:hypothetical protein
MNRTNVVKFKNIDKYLYAIKWKWEIKSIT